MSKLNVSQEWLDKSSALKKEMLDNINNKDTRDAIIGKNHKIWKLLKEELKILSFGKCWYSEAREIYSHYHVDHFRPKIRAIDDTSGTKVEREGYWWLAFDWTNYRLTGSVGNTSKSDYFAVKKNVASAPTDDCDDEVVYFLDPTKPNDYKKLTYNEDGSINAANPNEGHWDYVKATYTIQKLNLHYPDLVTARQIKWNNISTLIDEVDIAELEYQENPSAKREQSVELKIEQVRKLLSPCEELSSTVRACLRASRKQWALALLEENIDHAKYCINYIVTKEIEEDDNE